ncbi:cytochrome B subunit [bacterium]|nr:cytochrome B subunit [bacterium]
MPGLSATTILIGVNFLKDGMANFKSWITSSVGKKQIVGLTGFGIALFALMHMAGNLIMFISPKLYNIYGHQTTHMPLFPLLELLLLVAFLTHIGFTLWLVRDNKRARPVGNVSTGKWPKSASFAVRTIALSGLLLLVFLVLHVITFKYGTYYSISYDGVEVRDLYRLLVEKFQSPTYVAWYSLCLVILGLHLSHGIASICQSLGITGVRNPTLRKVSWALAILIAGGFFIQPFWIMCQGGGL